ncbi:CrcB family protein [Microbacterium sp. LRZ72]|uniref:fluoride efflux transporter FluC n=1 Tax=Microbacterium sp. LRZ72 TaxID=2942481 RepID=UPI0029A2E14D|nr:CrcB family protein [Microbacterium sp. LRZ72]MDX2377492.1 CrcB family protein [Microbacterium sp. LRZ72]
MTSRTWRLVPLVMIGGVLGVVLREALLLPAEPGVPTVVGTLAINIVGSAALGVVIAALGARHPRVRALLGTGLFGGFTTYSAFAVQAAVLLATPALALALAVASVALGVAAAATGLAAGRRLDARRRRSADPEEGVA